MDSERRTYTFADDDRSLGRLVTSAHGLDRTWVERSACRDYPAARNDSGWTWWMADFSDKAFPSPHEKEMTEKARMALMICHNCPVQYDCANYAVEGEMTAGTYGVRLSNLRWLQRGMNRIVLDKGRSSGLAVEDYVTRVRFRVPVAV